MAGLRWIAPLVLALLAWPAAPTGAQAPGDGRPVDERDSLRRIEVHLAEISRTLRELRAEQRVMRTLRRLELAERRLTPLRNELREAKATVEGAERERDELEMYATDIRETMRQSIAEGADPATVQGSEALGHYEMQLQLITTAIDAAERRVIDVEDELQAARRSTVVLEDTLEELIEPLDD